MTIVIGRGRPVGVTTATSGVLIGLEALCATNWLEANLEDRFVHTVAHEYGHAQQAGVVLDDPNPTVLEGSLVEGIAEFTAELISGGVSDAHFRVWTKGREKDIETAFTADVDKTDLSAWLYNTDPENNSPEHAGDLGYWVGYRIAKAYYDRAGDKRQALREMFGMTDPKAFLAKSGWSPGMRFP